MLAISTKQFPGSRANIWEGENSFGKTAVLQYILEVSMDKMKKCILSERRFLGRAVVVRQFSVKRLCLNKDYSSWSEDLGRY